MDDLIGVGKRHGVYVSTSTNAHHPTPARANLVHSGIDRLIISIDGATQDAYASYPSVGSWTRSSLEPALCSRPAGTCGAAPPTWCGSS